MPVYVDRVFFADPMAFADRNPLAKQASRWGRQWCHLWADTDADLDALHAIAKIIGLKRSYFQDRPRFPHYDLVPSKRGQAIKAGAVEMDLREWVRMRRRLTTH